MRYAAGFIVVGAVTLLGAPGYAAGVYVPQAPAEAALQQPQGESPAYVTQAPAHAKPRPAALAATAAPLVKKVFIVADAMGRPDDTPAPAAFAEKTPAIVPYGKGALPLIPFVSQAVAIVLTAGPGAGPTLPDVGSGAVNK